MQDSAAAYASTYLNLRNGGKNQSPTVLYTTQTAQKMARPTILLLLHVYSLQRERFYRAVA
jgi:hypothetical protein